MTILILHAIESHAGAHWQQWLHDELVKKGHTVIMPNLPDSDYPSRKVWLETVKDLVVDVDHSDLVIVGHSLGVVTALDYLDQAPKPIKALVSVSGFADDYHAELNSYFLAERSVDFEKVNKNLQNAFVLFGDDDPYVPKKSLHLLADNLHVKPKIYPNGGHLNTDAGYTKFDDLLEIITNL